MNAVLYAAIAAILAAICGLLIKRTNGEIALLFSLGAVVVIFLYLLPQVEMLSETARAFTESAELTEIIGVMLKALGIVLTARVAVHICKDTGENALAAGVDFAAKIATLLLLVPLMEQFLDMIREILVL